MASTNKTANLKLSQWEPGDAFRREDLNEDFTKIDAAVKALSGSALRMELLHSIDEAPGGPKEFSIDVSGIDFSEYYFIFLSFPESYHCDIRLNNGITDYGTAVSGTYVIGLPLGDSSMMVSLVSYYGGEFHVNMTEISYSQLKTIDLKLRNGGTLNTKIRLWGVK